APIPRCTGTFPASGGRCPKGRWGQVLPYSPSEAPVAPAGAAAAACHPQVLPSFCSTSHSCSGAKYSSTAEASIVSPPLSSFSVCCQGWLLPLDSIAQNFSPAALLPAKLHALSGPSWPAASHRAL